jgi:Leucine-rich repeat (LRR) protein
VARRLVAAHWGGVTRAYGASLARLDATLTQGPSLALALSDALDVTCGEDAPTEDARWARLLTRPQVGHLTALHIDDARSPQVARGLLATDALPNLERLTISGGIDAEDADALLGAPPATLRALDLSWCKLSDAALARALRPRAAQAQAALSSLDLTGNQASGLTAEALAASPLAWGLLSLNLTFNELDAGALASLLATPPPLASLTLSGNHIGPQGVLALVRALARSERLRGEAAAGGTSEVCGGLRTLSLEWCSVGDEGVIALAEGPPCGLTSLSLLANRIGSRGALALAASEALPLLETLNVSGNPISAQALATLRASPRLSSLRRLRYDR